MKNVMKGQAASTAAQLTTAQAQRLAELRYTVLDAVNHSPYTTAEEKAKTAVSVANCHSPETLVKWYCNVLTLLSDREQAPAVYATNEQKEQIIRLLNHPAVSRPRKTKVLLVINRLTQVQALDIVAKLTAETTPTPPRPAGAGLVVNGRGQLAVAALTRYADKALADGGVAVSYVQAA